MSAERGGGLGGAVTIAIPLASSRLRAILATRKAATEARREQLAARDARRMERSGAYREASSKIQAELGTIRKELSATWPAERAARGGARKAHQQRAQDLFAASEALLAEFQRGEAAARSLAVAEDEAWRALQVQWAAEDENPESLR